MLGSNFLYSLVFCSFIFFFWISLSETSVFKIQLESNFFSINLMWFFSSMTPDDPTDQFEIPFIITPLFTSPFPPLTSQFCHMYHTPAILNDLQLPKCTTSLALCLHVCFSFCSLFFLPPPSHLLFIHQISTKTSPPLWSLFRHSLQDWVECSFFAWLVPCTLPIMTLINLCYELPVCLIRTRVPKFNESRMEVFVWMPALWELSSRNLCWMNE